MPKTVTVLALALFVSLGTISFAAAQENMAKVHGTVYDWFTLEPLKNSIVEVNTTPEQTDVAPDGNYSFNLPPGDYTITASYWQDDVLLYYAEENLTILGTGGDYVVDLIAFPTFEENEFPEDNELIPEIPKTQDTWGTWLVLAAVVAVGAAAVVAFYYLKIRPRKKQAPAKPAEAAPPIRVVSLPDDLQEVMGKIRESDGRINQLELRKKLPYSEAKVSLMLADLESRGLIRKIKKGRGNIIISKE